jgi:membrane protease YdiL (CAAX protease family)
LATTNYQVPLFLAIDLYIVWFYLLKSFPVQADLNNAQVFAYGIPAALVIVIYLKQKGVQVVFDQNLTRKGLEYTLAAAAGVVAVVFYAGGIFSKAAFIYTGSVLAGIPSTVSDAVYNFVLVAPSEELLVLALGMGLTLQNKYPSLKKTVNAFIVARIGWGLLHTVLAYGNNFTAVAVAIILGIAFTLLMFQTKSVLTPIILHGTWNAAVILVPAAISAATLSPAGPVALVLRFLVPV